MQWVAHFIVRCREKAFGQKKKGSVGTDVFKFGGCRAKWYFGEKQENEEHEQLAIRFQRILAIRLRKTTNTAREVPLFFVYHKIWHHKLGIPDLETLTALSQSRHP